ncbi:Aldh8a1 [Columba guinea]|nr:Aldh8a1 [Columba guinea]
MAQSKALLVLENFIAGKFVPCSSYIDSYNPSTGDVYCRVPDSGKEEVEAAVKAAKAAFPIWSSKSPLERSQILNKLADLIEHDLEAFAQAESKDQGKTITFARTVDIPRAVYNFRFFASSILHHTTECTEMATMGCVHYTSRAPVGVAGLISPWNLPLYLLTWKIAPAIACGNTVVAKPSEMTSVTAWMMCKLLEKAGVPHGVVNIVFGTGPKAGEALVCHPDVLLISFTGSTMTAQRIMEKSAPHCKRLSLELGGKNPAIIFDDADLSQCIPTTLRSSFYNQVPSISVLCKACLQQEGEICLCTSRIFVQRGIYSEFLKKFVAEAKTWKVGNPSDPTVNMGALISKEHLEKVMLRGVYMISSHLLEGYERERNQSMISEQQKQIDSMSCVLKVRSYVKKAQAEGARILCGEGVDSLTLPPGNQKGYFMLPTVIAEVKDESCCMQEEIFGPVTCVVAFDTEEEVIERANNVKYGLAATVWSSNVGRVHRVAQKLQSGLVWTNCWLVRDLNLPFGGMKASGVGREGAKDSYEFFTEVKTITIKH